MFNDDWQSVGHKPPLLVNLQPAGEYFGEDFHRAGGVPAVVDELLEASILPYPNAITANGQTMGTNCETRKTTNGNVIKTVAAPQMEAAGFINLKGNLFDSAIMKTSVISPAFRNTYLSNPDDLNALKGVLSYLMGPKITITASTILLRALVKGASLSCEVLAPWAIQGRQRW